MSDFFSEAEARYVEVCERRAGTIAAWEDLGRPLLAEGSKGQLIDHPLVRQINELDRLSAQLGAKLQRRNRGPDPVGVVSASVGKSPAVAQREQRLKAV